MRYTVWSVRQKSNSRKSPITLYTTVTALYNYYLKGCSLVGSCKFAVWQTHMCQSVKKITTTKLLQTWWLKLFKFWYLGGPSINSQNDGVYKCDFYDINFSLRASNFRKLLFNKSTLNCLYCTSPEQQMK